MGLDQFLNRTTREDFSNPETSEAEEIYYWRKCNHFHDWVTKHLNNGEEHNCKQIVIDGEQLAGLARTCREVLINRHKASELLPTTAGFFFGSTEYDEWYFESLLNTAEMIEKRLEEEAEWVKQGNAPRVYFYDSWW